MGIGDDEADVGGDGPNIRYVVIDALQLEQNRAQVVSASGDFECRRALDCLAKCRSVRERRITRDTFRQKHRPVNWQMLEQLLGALMLVEHSQLEIQDR